jgi:hypothetical protein
MTLLYSGENLFEQLQNLVAESENLLMISPYIKATVLNDLLSKKSRKSNATIITTWYPEDILKGVSDLETYEVTKKYNCPLLLNQRIHLKAYLNYNQSGIIGSANLTQKGLGLVDHYNYEAAAIVDLELTDRLYFDRIIEEGILVTDSLFNSVKKQLAEVKLPDEAPLEFQFDFTGANYLLTSLPMIQSVDVLYKIYCSPDSYTQHEQQCAMADLRRYKIVVNKMNRDVFLKNIKKSFFDHPFIKDILAYNNSGERNGIIGRRFGDLRQWIKDNTTTVPVPVSPEVNEPLNNVLNWVVELSLDYEKYQPGHTIILRKVG